MSPFPLEAIDEVIWRIDEAIGSPESRGPIGRGWIKKAPPGEVIKFLENLKTRVSNIKFTLTNKEHQDLLRKDGYEPESVVLRDAQKSERDNNGTR